MRYAYILSIVVALASNTAAQSGSALPGDMVASFRAYGPYAETMDLPVNSGDRLYGRFWFSNAAGDPSGVWVKWTYRDGSAQQDRADVFMATSFKPTAICRYAGQSDILFVVGWSELLGRVVLEKWTFINYALGQMMSQGSTSAQSTLLGPIVRKQLLLECGSLPPIASIACNFRANRLWLLDEPVSPGNRNLWRLELQFPDCGPLTQVGVGVDPNAVVNVSNYSILQNMTAMYVGEHPTAGFMIYLQEKRQWVSGTAYQEPYWMIVLKDPGLDGVLEDVSLMTYLDLYTTHPAESWNYQYH